MRSWNYKLLCGAVCLAQLACLSLPVWAAQNSAAFTRQTTLQQLRDDPAIKSSGYYTYCRELSGLGNEYWKNKTLERYMRPELEQDAERAGLRRAVSSLSARERRIMELRFGLTDGVERTQKEAADALGISQSYISRLEKRIIQTLKLQLEGQ